MSKMSFKGFLGMLISFLDSEIQLEVIQTHKGHSRSRCRGQIPGKRSAVLFFHKSITDMSKMSFQGFLGMLMPFLDLEIKSEVILTHKGCSRSHCRGQIPEKKVSGPVFFTKASQICPRCRFRGFWGC